MSGIVLQPEEKDIRRVVEAIRELNQGRSNAVGEVTLRANQTTTTVTKLVEAAAVNCSVGSQIFLSPRTANAAGALATTWISAVGQGTFTLTHANTATVDRRFGFQIAG